MKFYPLETKIIFESPIQETTYIEIDDISEQLNERQKNAFSYVPKEWTNYKKGVYRY